MSETPVDRVLREFETAYGRPATVLAQAPGRINLIGEHTDYNDGFVLPVAINHYTWVAASPRDDALICATALDFHGERDRFVLDAQPPHHAEGGWRNYLRGALAQLHSELVLPGGLDLVVAGDIPQGAGLSSSASLVLSLLHAARAAHGLKALEPGRMAKLAQQAEVEFVGCKCGIMDQLASACGAADHALMIDCRSGLSLRVPLPPGLALLAVNSGISRKLVDSAYNDRRQDCEAAAKLLGVAALRDADIQALESARTRMPDLVYRRARHIVTENARVQAFAAALERGDLQRLGSLMAESHQSMRDDFEITVPAIDRLAELLRAAIGPDGGARMTGGGFGGCVVAVLRESLVPHVLDSVRRDYRTPGGELAQVYHLHAVDGATTRPVGET